MPQNKPVVVGYLLKADESNSDYYQFNNFKSSVKGRVQVSGDAKSSTVCVTSDSNIPGASHVVIKALNSSEKSGGTVKIKASSSIDTDSVTFNVTAKQGVQIVIEDVKKSKKAIVSYTIEQGLTVKDEFDNEITMTQDGVVITSKNIKIGDSDAEQGSVLSSELSTQLNKNKVRLDTLLQAIQVAPVTPGDGGASFKAFIVSAVSSLLSEDYSQIASKTSFVK
ncbi:MAG: hypothetical protein JHC54_16440 [Acinetobacter sp.]|nr:hypothetical protein [Acinetobacter sp.]